MKSTFILTVLMLCSLTASYAQTLIDPVTGDTLVCYDTQTLKKIANKIVYAKECDTLLKYQDQQIEYLDSTLIIQALMLANKNEIISYKDVQLEKKDTQIEEYEVKNKKLNRRLKLTKLGWATSSVILGSLLIFFMIN